MRFRGVPSAVALALAVVTAGCLHDGDAQTVTTAETETRAVSESVPAEAPTVLKVYFLRDGKVAPVARAVVAGPAVARAALEELLEGPTPEEGPAVETSIHAGVAVDSVAIADGVARVSLNEPLNDDRAYAQVVYTLTQFPTVKRVAVDARPAVARPALEEYTPAILVESPLPGSTVEPGFEVTGTANTFEATFHYELRDVSDRVISKDFVTATSGSGTRGTFRFTVPYETDRPQEGSLTVFEISAANGSRIKEVAIPLRLE